MRIAVLLVLALLGGCLDRDPAAPDDTPRLPGDTTDDPYQPAAGNARLYLHSDGGRHWMDTDAAATQTAIFGTWTLTDPEPWYRFALQPTTARDLVFQEGGITLDLNAHGQSLLLEDTVLLARLVVDGQVGEAVAATGGRVVLPAPERVPAQTPFAVEACVCPTPTTVFYNYDVITDGSSRLMLPLSSPRYIPAPNGTTGAVETGQTADGRWYARQTLEFGGALGDASALEIVVSTGNGAVDVAPHDDGYHIEAALEGRGETEEEARQRLAAIQVEHEARPAGKALLLRTSASTADGSWQDQMAAVRVHAQPLPIARLEVDTTNGQVHVEDHTGGDWSLTSTNGGIRVVGEADEVVARTSNGEITLEGVFDHIDAATSNAPVTLRVEAAASGTWSATTANGGIDVQAPEDEARGYDVEGHTTNGAVDFAFDDTEPVGDQSATHRHERTTGFDGRTIQTTITLETTNGDIDAGP